MSRSDVDGIICFSTDPWGEMKRPGQLMRCLSRHTPVVYVEPYLSVTSVLKNWRSAFSADAVQRLRRAVGRTPMEVEPGVHVLSSLVTVPPQRMSFLPSARALGLLSNGQHRRAVARALRAARRVGVHRPVLWVTYPISLPAGGKLDHAVMVYDCMDRWTDFPDSLSDAKWQGLVTAYEQQLLEDADVVFCSADGLYQAKRDSADRVVLLRNAADVEHFAPADRRVPADLAALPRPILGYVGALADWLDFQLLRSVALSRPDWSIVLIGPIFKGKTSGDARALKLVSDLPNVHLMGPRAYGDVPAYLEAFDVATIPFKLNGLTEDTNPIKVYEYLAAGVPVVSTPLPEVTDLPGVHVASDAEQFVSQSEKAIRERWDPDLVSARIAVAEDNSWETRARIAWSTVTENIGAQQEEMRVLEPLETLASPADS